MKINTVFYLSLCTIYMDKKVPKKSLIGANQLTDDLITNHIPNYKQKLVTESMTLKMGK